MSGTVYPFVVDLVGRRSGRTRTVLEVGCGTMEYAQEFPGEYLGLDLPSWTGIERDPDIVASVEAIPIDDRSVDVVFGVAVFYYVDDVERALRECRRVLRPGGRLLIFDYTRRTIEGLRAAGDDLVRHAWDSPDLRRLLIDAGFPRSGIRDLSHRASDRGDPPLWRRPLRRLKRRLDPDWTQWLVIEARR